MKTIKIPKHKVADFKLEVSRFNNKAREKNLPLITYKFGKEFKLEFTINHDGDESVITVPGIEIEISDFNPIIINGWELVGVIKNDITLSYNHKYMKHINPKEIDFSRCDHCHINRERNEIWILVKDSKIMYVGSTCVKDFTGISFPFISFTV